MDRQVTAQPTLLYQCSCFMAELLADASGSRHTVQ